jgi:hypothetical protein
LARFTAVLSYVEMGATPPATDGTQVMRLDHCIVFLMGDATIGSGTGIVGGDTLGSITVVGWVLGGDKR